MNERILIYQARQAVYILLQRLYQDSPDPTLLNWLVTDRPFAEFPIALDDSVTATLQQVERASQTTTVEALRHDFRQLYVGPGPMRVPPWESVYRNEDRLLFDKHTLQVRETYARHGLEFVNKNQAPEDSIAIELEFMRILTERLLQAVDAGNRQTEWVLLEEQVAFLQKHLLVWMPQFVSLSQKHAETEFYAGLAGVLGSFLAWEKDTLEQLLSSMEEDSEPSPTPS
jgi:putative dimethyl sulfoxide reductase chaperone